MNVNITSEFLLVMNGDLGVAKLRDLWVLHDLPTPTSGCALESVNLTDVSENFLSETYAKPSTCSECAQLYKQGRLLSSKTSDKIYGGALYQRIM
jgi:hypothetical protein